MPQTSPRSIAFVSLALLSSFASAQLTVLSQMENMLVSAKFDGATQGEGGGWLGFPLDPVDWTYRVDDAQTGGYALASAADRHYAYYEGDKGFSLTGSATAQVDARHTSTGSGDAADAGESSVYFQQRMTFSIAETSDVALRYRQSAAVVPPSSSGSALYALSVSLRGENGVIYNFSDQTTGNASFEVDQSFRLAPGTFLLVILQTADASATGEAFASARSFDGGGTVVAQAVPEPASMAALALGALGIARGRRRRKA